jgi:hypothetical protein
MNEAIPQGPDEQQNNDADDEYAKDLWNVVTEEVDGVLTPVVEQVHPFVVRAYGYEQVFEHEEESINNVEGGAANLIRETEKEGSSSD